MSRRLLPFAALLLASCQFAPPHVRPDLPTPPAWPSVAPSDGRVKATDLGWRQFFNDQRLETLIEAALTNNRDLRVAVARIEEARGAYRIEQSQRLPNVTGSGAVLRNRTATLTGEPTTFTAADIGVGVTAFELDFWGRVRNLSDAARARYLATVEAERAFRLSLIRDVASLYFAETEARQRIALAEATLESRATGRRIARRRLDAGLTSALDYRQAEALYTQAETELAAQRLFMAQNRNALAVLIGGPLSPNLPEARPLEAQLTERSLDPGLPSDLLLSRPDVIAAEQQLIAARADVGAARAAFFPNISLTGQFGFASTDLDNLFNKDSQTWSFGPVINIPLFDFGARQGNLDVARAREVIEVATYERTVQNAFREVSDALAGRRFLAEEVSSLERGVEAQAQIARLAQLRYQEGVAQYLEVLDAERNLFTARQSLIQMRRLELENLVSLYVALGGGSWKDIIPAESLAAQPRAGG